MPYETKSTLAIDAVMKKLIEKDKNPNREMIRLLNFDVVICDSKGKFNKTINNVPASIDYRRMYVNQKDCYDVGIHWEDAGLPNYKDLGLYGSYWTNETYVEFEFDSPNKIVIRTKGDGPIMNITFRYEKDDYFK